LVTMVERHDKGTAQRRWAPRCLWTRLVRQKEHPKQ
jgi:hypothetical protein